MSNSRLMLYLSRQVKMSVKAGNRQLTGSYNRMVVAAASEERKESAVTLLHCSLVATECLLNTRISRST